MITPTIIAQALAGAPAALTTLRVAITQAINLGMSGALNRFGSQRPMMGGPTAMAIDHTIADKVFDEDGKLLRDWAEKPSVCTFDEYIERIAEYMTIVLLAARGDQHAAKFLWQTFYNATKGAIGNVLGEYVVYRYRDAHEALKDFLVEAYEKLWDDNQRVFLGWRPALGPRDAYLATVAANHARDACRKRQEQLMEGDDPLLDWTSEAEGPEDWVIRMDFASKVLQRLRTMQTTQAQREMLRLIVELGLTVDEICQRTGKSEDSVYQWRAHFSSDIETIRKKLDSDPVPSSRIKSAKKK